nr:Kinesin light chain 5 [Colletotrichum truncatum]KAF6794162.1 Kinesin light chain 5 [Colletotrichum truncatum]
MRRIYCIRLRHRVSRLRNLSSKDLLLVSDAYSVYSILSDFSLVQKDLHHLHQTADKTTAAVENMRSEQNILLVRIRNDMHDIKSSKGEDLAVARSPQFVMPFTSDADFVNRSDIWTWIEEQHAGPVSRFALVGLGGFGKSQMAIQFAYHLRAVAPNASIFWVNGSSKATFEESYRNIANVLALPRRHDPDIDILALVRDWLQREDAGTWLMIVDNADDMEVFFSKESDQYDAQLPVASYLPKTETGKILVTSRSWDAAERLTGNGKAILKVPTMEEAQTLQLLKKKLGSDIDEAAALRLIQTLEYIPLAVSQAAAYIHKRSGRVTIQSYLEEFQKSENRKGTLLRSDRGDIRRYEGVSNSVIVTWQVTFEQIKREQPRAAGLLSLMSYFQAQNIPEYMLHDYKISAADAKESDNEGEEIGSSDDFEDDLDVLRGYSLVTLTSTLGFCEMHSLVQFCTKIWISKFGDSRRCERLFLKSASLHFPSGVFETWEQSQILMPHIQPLLEDEPIEDRGRLEWSELLTNVSWYILMQGEYDRAEAVVQEAVRVRKDILGPEHPSTLTSMANLASTYRNQGRWEEAEKLEVQVMETSVTKLGADHPSTLSSMANLAATYWNQGRWEEAEKLEVQVMETRVTKLGADHPDTLSSMANLAFTWKDQGRRDDAIQLLQDCVDRRQRCLGIDHPDTVSAKSNLVEWTEESDGDWTDESDC